MVQVMETWLIADTDALQAYFGPNFKSQKIPAWADLEIVPKLKIFDALEKASADCVEKQYAKGKVSFGLLGTIDPEKVKLHCSHAARFLRPNDGIRFSGFRPKGFFSTPF